MCLYANSSTTLILCLRAASAPTLRNLATFQNALTKRSRMNSLASSNAAAKRLPSSAAAPDSVLRSRPKAMVKMESGLRWRARRGRVQEAFAGVEELFWRWKGGGMGSASREFRRMAAAAMVANRGEERPWSSWERLGRLLGVRRGG